MTYKAIFIGADYKENDYRRLYNIQNVTKFSDYIKNIYNLDNSDFEIITDDTKCKSSYDGILLKLYKLGLDTWTSDIDTVFIYYIGDTINVKDYIKSYTGNYDIKQGVVPSDYDKNGIIDKDELYKIFQQFNPKTQIIFIADSCFIDGNIFNLDYIWSQNKESMMQVNENNSKSKIITISYNLSNYSSDENNYYNLLLNNETINKKSIGEYLTKLSYVNDDIFDILNDVNNVLNKKDINMTVSLASSYNLSDADKNIFKCFEKSMFNAMKIDYSPSVHFRPIQVERDEFSDYEEIYTDISNEIKKHYEYIEQNANNDIRQCNLNNRHYHNTLPIQSHQQVYYHQQPTLPIQSPRQIYHQQHTLPIQSPRQIYYKQPTMPIQSPRQIYHQTYEPSYHSIQYTEPKLQQNGYENMNVLRTSYSQDNYIKSYIPSLQPIQRINECYC